MEFPPRGSGLSGRIEAPPSQLWVHPEQLGESWTWQPGRFLIGRWGDRLIGRDDDRHAMAIAGTRSGKSLTLLIPNLLRYPGSVLVLDPKGELVRATAAARRRMGQKVIVLDPFGVSGETTASHNPFAELMP